MKKNTDKKVFIGIGAIVIALIVIITMFPSGKGSGVKVSADGKRYLDGYTEITSVEGSSFFINKEFVDKATAVTELSDDVTFDGSRFYTYNNGSDRYILFSMEGIVVAAQKGTTFHLSDASDKLEALKGSKVMNIWFDQGTKKLEMTSKKGITDTKVRASVSINKTTYGDFAGRLITIGTDADEWSLFAGVPGSEYDLISDAAKDGIDKIVSTFALADGTASDKSIYAVSLDGKGTKEEVGTQTETGEDGSEKNQNKIVEKNGEMAYTSSPYAMLSIGDNGLLSLFYEKEGTYEDAIIKPTAVYRGEDAVSIIKEFCEETKLYPYADPMKDCEWNVLVYDLNYAYCESDKDGYVNIVLKGMDGDTLKFDERTFSARTFDMTHRTEKDGDWIRGYMVYYPIPIGCMEYCIKAGESITVEEIRKNSAYYAITEKDYAVKEEPSPSPEPTAEPTEEPSPSPEPTIEPSEEPSPSPEPTEEPTAKPTKKPSNSGGNKKPAASKPKEEPAPAPAPAPVPIVPAPEDNGGVIVDEFTIIN